jgi:hypothetical protein
MPRLAYQGPYLPEMVPLFSPAPQIAVDYIHQDAGPQGDRDQLQGLEDRGRVLIVLF